jgi:hypothetical protein
MNNADLWIAIFVVASCGGLLAVTFILPGSIAVAADGVSDAYHAASL